MVYGLWQSAAGMAANQYRQNVAANNIANINTVGFKHDLAMLVERPVESREDGDARQFAHAMFDMLSGGTHVRPTIQTFEQGPVMTTGKPLDAMIQGKGLFAVQTDEGVRYTRDGNFARSSEGLLVTAAEGHPVLDSGGGTITIPAEGGRVQFLAPGDTELNEAGQIELAQFVNPEGLKQIGKNLYRETDASGTPITGNPQEDGLGAIRGGFLEMSNVEPVRELIELIKTQRGFELNSQSIQSADESLQVVANLRRF